MESTCTHQTISLIKADTQERLRCRHCHLVITSDELGNSYCPECFETTGKKNNSFEPVAPIASEKVRYRCDSCGIIIVCE